MPAGHEPAENTHLKMAKALKFKAFVGWCGGDEEDRMSS